MGHRIDLLVGAPMTAIRHVRRRWWRTAPFLPLPSSEHLAWRRATAYGEDRPVDTDDLVTFLAWAGRQERVRS